MNLTKEFHPENILSHLAWRESVCLGSPILEQLSDRLGYSLSYVSNLPFKMERNGLVTRHPDCEHSLRLVK